MAAVFARSPQAKGRIERLWKTFQDRLTAEIELNQVTFEQVNDFVQGFVEDFNRRFQVIAPQQAVYKYTPKDLDFNLIFGHRETRKTDVGGVLVYKGSHYVLQEKSLPAKVRVEITRALDDSICIVGEDGYAKLTKIAKPVRIKPNKITPKKHYRPPLAHPWHKFSITRPNYRALAEKREDAFSMPRLKP